MFCTFLYFVKIECSAGQEILATYVVKAECEQDVETARDEYLKKVEKEYPLARFPNKTVLKTVSFTELPEGNVFGMFLNGHRQGEVE
jgi:hypothetical protein